MYALELLKNRESAMQTRQLGRSGVQLPRLDRSHESREASAGIFQHEAILPRVKAG
jgi:hypothetical protein